MKKVYQAIETFVVLEYFLMSNLPPGRTNVGYRWIYTESDDGTQRLRTLAQDFSQVPVKALTDCSTLVKMDLDLCIALISHTLI
jgi:hypothetical protein